MNASEKKKYVIDRIMEKIKPYGYFTRYGMIWKYSLSGKYVVCISCELDSFGYLKEIWVEMSTFYAQKITVQEHKKTELAFSCISPLAHSVLLHGWGNPLLRGDPTFEEQWEAFQACFDQYAIPLLPVNDDPREFLAKLHQMMQLNVLDVKIDEFAYGYLALEQTDEALSAIDQHINLLQHEIDQKCATPESIRRYSDWINALRDIIDATQTLRQRIENKDEVLRSEMERREYENLTFCKHFFHIK